MDTELVKARVERMEMVERLALRLVAQCVERGATEEESVMGLLGGLVTLAGGEGGAVVGIEWLRNQVDRVEAALLAQQPKPRLGL